MRTFFFFYFLIATHAFARQIPIARVELMPAMPKPFHILDFRNLAHDFDRKAYDPKQTGEGWPLVWKDQRGRNGQSEMNVLFTAMGDLRQGQHNNGGGFHESLSSMGAILGASLVGIDKRSHAEELQGYFNRDTGWDIMQNNTDPSVGALGGGYGRDWWYDVFPNVLFYSIFDHYRSERQQESARKIADKFLAADEMLKGNYNYTYFDYGKMTPVNNWICAQADAAAGHAYVLYSAYKAFGEKKYLEAAKRALAALEWNKTNPSYEVLMPFGALVAARLNAEEGSDFNVEKLLNWTFEPVTGCRKGWGVLVDRWNGFDVSGLMGSVTDHGGYGFVMNTYDMAWPLIPLVRYDQRFASALGKWMLNAANAIRFAYPDHAGDIHQTLPHKKAVSKGVIAYEGIIKSSTHAEYRGQTKAPVAQGDGPKWLKGNPDISQLSVYGSAHVGIFGSIIEKTNVPGILKLNLLATDSFRAEAYPSYLLYNPHLTKREVHIMLPSGVHDLYDSVSGKFISKKVSNSTTLKVSGRSSVVLIITPHQGKLERRGKQTLVNGIVIDYQTKTKWF